MLLPLWELNKSAKSAQRAARRLQPCPGTSAGIQFLAGTRATSNWLKEKLAKRLKGYWEKEKSVISKRKEAILRDDGKRADPRG